MHRLRLGLLFVRDSVAEIADHHIRNRKSVVTAIGQAISAFSHTKTTLPQRNLHVIRSERGSIAAQRFVQMLQTQIDFARVLVDGRDIDLLVKRCVSVFDKSGSSYMSSSG